MITMRPFEIALAAAVVLAGLEVITGTFVLLGFSLGCLAVAAAEAWGGGVWFTRDILLFAAVGTVAIFGLRFAFARHGDSTRAQGDVNEY